MKHHNMFLIKDLKLKGYHSERFILRNHRHKARELSLSESLSGHLVLQRSELGRFEYVEVAGKIIAMWRTCIIHHTSLDILFLNHFLYIATHCY